MEHRTFEAPTMPAALELVKKSLGADAVIIQTRTRPPGPNPNRVTIIAQAPRAQTTGAPPEPAAVPMTSTSRATAGATRRTAAGSPPSLAPAAPKSWTVPDADPAAPIIRNRRGATRRRAASPVPAVPLPSSFCSPAEERVSDRVAAAPPPRERFPSEQSGVVAAAESAVAPSGVIKPSAASGPRDAEPAPDLATLSDALRTAYQRLVTNDVAEELARHLLAQVACGTANPTPQQIDSHLRTLIRDMLPQTAPISLTPGEQRRVAIVGPAGAGKTTTVAKLAAQFKIREGRNVVLLTLDSQRLAAREQLARYAEIIEAPLHGAQGVDEVHDLLARCDADLLLIDTPGIGPREEGRFVRLAALLRSARPHEVHLALPGSLSAGACRLAMQRFAPLRVSHLLLTRLDEAVGMGVLLSTLSQAALRLSYVTSGQRVPTDLAAASADEIAAGILAPV
ncbi:MAG: AAA family ATPase [Planctomycetia bacterium]|nr:MAG: AAA family ATPase [Planctomycetia bacterium]